MIRLVWVGYLWMWVALCCVSVVVHLIGEQGHEERETGDVARARLSTVERLGGNISTGHPSITASHKISTITIDCNTDRLTRRRHCIISSCLSSLSAQLSASWTITPMWPDAKMVSKPCTSSSNSPRNFRGRGRNYYLFLLVKSGNDFLPCPQPGGMTYQLAFGRSGSQPLYGEVGYWMQG